MLTGKVYHQLDDKNRIRIPAKFRDSFRDEKLFSVEYGLDCISIMPESVLNLRMQQLCDTDPGNPDKWAKMVRISSAAEEIKPDGQGRIMLSRAFREFAGIEKEVVFVGAFTYVTLWAREIFEEKIEKMPLAEANKAYRRTENAQE